MTRYTRSLFLALTTSAALAACGGAASTGAKSSGNGFDPSCKCFVTADYRPKTNRTEHTLAYEHLRGFVYVLGYNQEGTDGARKGPVNLMFMNTHAGPAKNGPGKGLKISLHIDGQVHQAVANWMSADPSSDGRTMESYLMGLPDDVAARLATAQSIQFQLGAGKLWTPPATFVAKARTMFSAMK